MPQWLQNIGNAINDSCLFNYMVDHPIQGGIMVGLGSGLILVGGSYLLSAGYTGIGIAGTTCVAGGCQKAVDITFQTGHAIRHFEGTGLTSTEIEEVIRSDVLNKAIPEIGQFTERVVNIKGYEIVYRLNQWKDGVVNIGTYFIKNK